MAIHELMSLVAPPANPVDATNGARWRHAQEAIGTKLPTDFRDIAIRYGTGTFCGFLSILNPLSDDFQPSVIYLLGVLREIKQSRDYPYGVFPDRPGMLPWGGDDNGNMLHWLTEGDPDDWPVLIESHEGEFERFHIPTTTFMSRVFKNDIRPRHVWNRPFGGDELVFVPMPPKRERKRRTRT